MLSATLGRSPRPARWRTCAILCAGALAIAAALTAPALAGAGTTEGPLPGGFVPYKSVSAVHLGMKEKAVRAMLGEPNSVNVGSGGQDKPSQLIYTREQAEQSLIITFDQHRSGDPVAHIQASGNSFRTKGGVGIGSTKASVLRAIPHLKSESGSLVGERGPYFLEIDFFHGRANLIGLADTRLKTF